MTEPIYRKEHKTRFFDFVVEVYHDLSVHLVKLPVLKNVGDHYASQECLLFRADCDPEWMEDGDPKEWLSLAEEMSNIRSRNYVVMEYVGRESASSNNCPDIALDGFLDCELIIALDEIEQDDQLAAVLMTQNSIRKMLVND